MKNIYFHGNLLVKKEKFKSHSFSFDTFVRKEERKKRNAELCSKNPLYYLTEQNGCLFMLAAVILTKQHDLVQLDNYTYCMILLGYVHVLLLFLRLFDAYLQSFIQINCF